MFCPTCQTVIWAALETCPTCGDSMRAVMAGDAIEVVEATFETGTSEPAQDASTAPDVTALTIVEPPALPLPVRLAELSVAAWRQPAVRAAVKTGASALALSLALRAARRALTRAPSPPLMARPAPPLLADLLPREATNRRERGAVVIETFVYVRHVVRR